MTLECKVQINFALSSRVARFRRLMWAVLAQQGYSQHHQQPSGWRGRPQPAHQCANQRQPGGRFGLCAFPVGHLMISAPTGVQYYAQSRSAAPHRGVLRRWGRANALFQATGCRVGRPA